MNRSWSSRLLRIGTFLILFGGYLLFLKEPTANRKQRTFRVAVPSIGGVLVVAGLALKAYDDEP